MGYLHPDFLLQNLTSGQINEWKAYDRLEPIDSSARNEFMLAKLCTLISNIMRSIWGKKGTKMLKITDFYPEWDYENRKNQIIEPRQSMDEMKRVLGLKK